MRRVRSTPLRLIRVGTGDGFTLVEVLIAMLILAVGLLSMATLAGTVLKGNSYSNRKTTATTLAQETMETIERIGYANADSAVGTEGYGTITNYSAYKRVTSVTASSPAAGMKTVAVTVYWDEDAHSVALQTILAQ